MTPRRTSRQKYHEYDGRAKPIFFFPMYHLIKSKMMKSRPKKWTFFTSVEKAKMSLVMYIPVYNGSAYLQRYIMWVQKYHSVKRAIDRPRLLRIALQQWKAKGGRKIFICVGGHTPHNREVNWLPPTFPSILTYGSNRDSAQFPERKEHCLCFLENENKLQIF